MNNKRVTKAELARMANTTRPTLDKHLKTLLTDPVAKLVLKEYKPKLGFSPKQVDFLTTHLPLFD